jgi:hypothetical protein
MSVYCRRCTNTYHREKQRELRKTGRFNSLRQRELYLKRTYGLTLQEYEEQLAHQRGVCAICQRSPKEKTLLRVDHCHKTQAIRGLLCDTCNRGIGYFQDDAKALRRAADYVS